MPSAYTRTLRGAFPDLFEKMGNNCGQLSQLLPGHVQCDLDGVITRLSFFDGKLVVIERGRRAHLIFQSSTNCNEDEVQLGGKSAIFFPKPEQLCGGSPGEAS